MPDVFPDQHNQNTGVEVLAQFEPVSIAFTTSRQDPPREVLVCQGADFASTATSCVMQWCEARYVSDEPTWEGNGTCTCKRRMTTGCSGSAAPVRVRFVGPSSLTDLQLSLHVVNHLFAWPDATSLDLSVEARRDMIEEARTKPQLLQQVWDTGETSLSNTMEISVGFTRQETSSCAGMKSASVETVEHCSVFWTPGMGLPLWIYQLCVDSRPVQRGMMTWLEYVGMAWYYGILWPQVSSLLQLASFSGI